MPPRRLRSSAPRASLDPTRSAATRGSSRVTIPNTTRKSRICSWSWLKSSLGWSNLMNGSIWWITPFSQFTRGRRGWAGGWSTRLRRAERSVAKGTSEQKNANASVPNARSLLRVWSSATRSTRPSAAAAAVPMTTAQKKLICPWVAMPGTSMPQSRLNAQPAANPPAVTNDAWARLTMPPMPVTTTNDRKMIADRQALRDHRLVVGVGLQPRRVEPLHREGDQGHGPDDPRQPSSECRHARAVIGSRHVIGHRPARGDGRARSQQQDQHQEEGHRGLQPAQVVRGAWQQVVAVTGDQVLDHTERQTTSERDRDRPQAAQHDRRQASRARPACTRCPAR